MKSAIFRYSVRMNKDENPKSEVPERFGNVLAML